jgi:hypothetical protein
VVISAAAVLVLLTVVVLLISSPKGAVPSDTGAIRVEFDDPRAQVEVQIDGERLDRAALHEPLRLQAGEHHLLVTGKRIQTVSQPFTVARGDNPVLRVGLVPRAEDDDPGRGRRGRRPRDDDGRDDDDRDDDR